MLPYIEKSLVDSMLRDSSDKNLFDYLDEQFEIYSQNLYEDVFKKILQQLWTSITQVIKISLK